MATTRTKDTSGRVPFNEYLAHQIEMSDKSQKEIASQCGYDNPNIITMFKKGLTKVPITKLPKMADTLGIDRVHLMRLGMIEYAPEIWAALQDALGNVVTDNELEIIETIRSVVGNNDPKMDAEAKKQIKAAAKSLK